jgi:hypothetical protein
MMVCFAKPMTRLSWKNWEHVRRLDVGEKADRCKKPHTHEAVHDPSSIAKTKQRGQTARLVTAETFPVAKYS